MQALSRLILLCLSLTLATSTLAAPPKGVGLVLGGGGARGLAHVGVLAELERLRVPIACIAGTSAGALVGGIYASGMPIDTFEKELVEADWNRLLTGAPRRADLPYNRKRDDFKNLADLTLGVSRSGVLVPRAAVSTQEIDVFLRRLTRDIEVDDFDKLPIPFQAVATDLVSGEAVEFKRGDLAVALRASMAVPGVFDLLESDNKLLVDGMLVRNVPVQNVKGRCADKVIVIDVGTPLLKADEIHSLLDVATQQSNILVGRNVREQLALMGPDDLLITPNLTGFTAADFNLAKDIIARGRAAIEPFRERLAEFSVLPEQYAEWKASLLPRRPVENSPYDEVKIADTRFVPKDLLGSVFGKRDQPLEQQQMLQRVSALYELGDFDRVSYSLRNEDGRRVVDVYPMEKLVGPNYLRFGLDFKIDTYRNSNVSFLGNLQLNWLNSWGLQWRNDVRVGSDSYYVTELMQPLALSRFFVATGGSLDRSSFSLFSDEGDKLGIIGFNTRALWADLGYSLGRYGEMRLGAYGMHYDAEVEVGMPLPRIDGRLGGFSGRLIVDQLDNPRFPRDGYYLRLGGIYAKARQDDLNVDTGFFLTANSSLDVARTFGRYTLRASAEVEGAFTNSASETGSIHSLGGFLRLSGFQDGEFVGSRTVLGRVMAYRQIKSLLPTLGSGMYVGGSFESGRVWNEIFHAVPEQYLYAGSLFVGLDTLLGPLYMAYGQGEGGRRAGYLYLGVDY